MKKRTLALAATVISSVVFVRKLSKSLRITVENRTNEPLDLYIGTKHAPDAMAVKDLGIKEKQNIDLTNLPLMAHDAVYVRFPGKDGKESYVRTLIYDVDERRVPSHVAIVDYGKGIFDLRIVK